MTNIMKAAGIVKYQFIRAISSYKILIIITFLSIYIYTILDPINSFAMSLGMKVSPWLFPHLTNYYSVQLIIMACAVALFCDAPFTENSHTFILARAGRKSWIFGHIMHIVVLSFLYVFIILLISIISVASVLQWTLSWGKILGTLARTNASMQIRLQFKIQDYIIGALTPISAMTLSFLLEWACVSVIGLLIYVINALTKKSIGTVFASGLILVDLMISNEWIPSGYKFSPITLAQLTSFAGENAKYGISLSYATWFFIISIILLCIGCYISQYLDYIIARIKIIKRKRES